MTYIETHAPAGFRTVAPYLTVANAPRLIEFLERTFDALEVQRNLRSDETIRHAECRIGDSIVMIGQAGGEWHPQPAHLHVYVANTDATYRRALDAGGTSTREPADQEYGDRMAGVRDPTGNTWWIASRIAKG